MTASTTPPSPPSAEASGFTILCVDDEPNILSALRRLFRPRATPCGWRAAAPKASRSSTPSASI
jgi:hypothetical protein